MFYSVLEIQEGKDGVRGCIPIIFDSYDAALAKYYQVLSVAAAGTLPYHACVILASTGQITDERIFDRREV